MFGRDLRARYHRWLARRRPIPDRLWSAALARTTYARALPRGEGARLRELATLFLRRKRFEGAAGFVPGDAVRVAVALKACVPILNLGLAHYSGWSGIVVYPGDFRVYEEYMDEAGVVHRGVSELCGQSLSQGPLVLSWETIEAERTTTDRDLVMHECAHKLDVVNGPADGFPSLPADLAQRWTEIFRDAYDALGRAIAAGAETRLDPYGASDPAEFFAVATETFFTAPEIVRDEYPAVYDALRDFYRQDPLRVLRHRL